jgi:hypothetical protein
MSEVGDCSEAYKNPSCPYVTQININTSCMKQVDKALISLLARALLDAKFRFSKDIPHRKQTI